MSNPLYRAQAEIRAVFAQSTDPAHARHAEDTLAWVMRLNPATDAALALAALAHDIDCVDAPSLASCHDGDFNAFKSAHAQASARILRNILVRCDVSGGTVRKACHLVELHEFGGEPEANVLRDADSLSCFSVNLPLYYERKGQLETLQRGRWDYARLSQRGRRYFADIRHNDPRLDRILLESTMPQPT